MAEERMKILEERLTRLEATLTQRAAATGTGGTGGFTPPGGVITDPAPWAGQWQFIPRQVSPVVDPAPWPWGGGWTRPRWPTPVVDPGPFPTPVVDPAPWPNPIVDPAVLAQANLAARLGRVGPIGDPPPPDIGRLNVSQLEATIHSIAAERARLDAMESMVNKQIEVLKKQQPG
jgi:hypothetical protein